MLSLVLFILTYVVAGCIHELSHLLIATLLVRIQNKRQNKKHYKSSSFFNSNIHEENLYSIVFFRKIKISHLSIIHDAVVRHFGWILSVTVAILSTIFFILLKNHYEYTTSIPVLAGLWITAIEAIGSDLFTFFGSHQPGIFLCGNFGLILLNLTHEHLVRPILEKMITVTMMRGAQSGGVVTFLPNGSAGLKGSRSRVVNGKRTNLSKLIGSKMTRDLQFRKILSGGLLKTPRVYAGHTRFATSSVSSLPGTHPHQWTPSRTYVIWSGFLDGNFTCSSKNVEVFICHNGDFDFFTIKDKIYSVEEIQKWLPMVTHAPMPCSVDSAAVAGVMDVLRTQGSWYMSIRYAIVFAMDWTNLDEASRSQKAIQAVADVFERLFKECLGTSYKVSGDAWTAPNLRQRMKTIAESSSTLLTAINTNINKNSIESISQHISAHAAELEAFKAGIFNGSDLERGERFDDIDTRFITSVIDAFFDNDLLASTRFFFAHAKGSFGLCVTCSLDADRQLCLGARGQTISIALYPSVGMVLYGSEQAAVKAAIGLIPDNVDLGPAMRLDLDDLGGEVCLVDWGDALVGSESMNIQKQVQMQHETSIHAKKIVQKLNFCSIHGVSDTVKLICFQESMKSLYNLKKRMVCIQGNELVLPIPPTGDDIVGDDIHDTPRIIKNIQEASSGINYFYLGHRLIKRLRHKRSEDKSLDILITGCEISLWLSEQFAADLNLVFPKLKVKAISANKILGLLGQDFPIPSTGFDTHEQRLELTNTIVIVVSHSGGTFSSLAVSNLLQAYTDSIFVVTSEWDTQIGKQLRKLHLGFFKNPIFSTDCGIRCAEPCSVTVAATHQLLTNILVYFMSQIHNHPDLKEQAGCKFSDLDIAEIRQLGKLNVDAIANICGSKDKSIPLSETEKSLREQGRIWSQHALEGPISWILCAVYIFATLISGWPIAYAIGYGCGIYSHSDEYSSAPIGPLNPAGTVSEDDPHGYRYLIAFFDAIIYLFLPQWTTFLIRLVQGRHLFHRMGVRSIVIGDIPWVAQCVEAFGSKLFGCAYSNASFNFYSANPSDHLVHRFTHRVVRGGLLLVGRPDGRLSALTSAEAAVCLSVNQASSIQSLGIRCESVTIGHNPYKLPLSERALVLPSYRPDYLCDHMLKARDMLPVDGKSPNALLGDFINMKEKGKPNGVTNDDNERIHELLPILSLSPYSFHNLSIMTSPRKSLGRRQSTVVQERFFGEVLLERDEEGDAGTLMVQQSLSQRLYESRYASMQRCVACFVLLHETSKRVSQFWSTVSFGILGYEMHRTHSIMRIATTASPISGSEVRSRMLDLALAIEVKNSQRIIRKFLRNTLIAKASRQGVNALLRLLERPLFRSQTDLAYISSLVQNMRSSKTITNPYKE